MKAASRSSDSPRQRSRIHRALRWCVFWILWLTVGLAILPSTLLLMALGVIGRRAHARRVWDWWEAHWHWLRVQAVLTPVGSLLMAFAVSRAGKEPSPELSVISGIIVGTADSASAGVLFYTACSAALEGGIWSMVLGRALHRKLEADRKAEIKRRDAAARREGRQEGIAIALSALQEKREDETLQQAIERLEKEQSVQDVG